MIARGMNAKRERNERTNRDEEQKLNKGESKQETWKINEEEQEYES